MISVIKSIEMNITLNYVRQTAASWCLEIEFKVISLSLNDISSDAARHSAGHKLSVCLTTFKALMCVLSQSLRIGLSVPNIVSFIVLLRNRCPQEPAARVEDLHQPGAGMGQQRGGGKWKLIQNNNT